MKNFKSEKIKLNFLQELIEKNYIEMHDLMIRLTKMRYNERKFQNFAKSF